MKPVLIDLFCGAGGAAMGYHRAGFEVVGVDAEHQPNYPFEFVRADWAEALSILPGVYERSGREYAVHASPPCQPYASGTRSSNSPYSLTRGLSEPRLIAPVRERLRMLGAPYVIENVEGAGYAMVSPTLLCGLMFNLLIPRHRMFETNMDLLPPAHPNCAGIVQKNATRLGWDRRDLAVAGKGRHAGTSQKWAGLLGITWPMAQRELSEAIPPVYTAWIGMHLLLSMQKVAA